MSSQPWLRDEEHLKGVLIGPTKTEEDTYVVLFPYTRQGVGEIRPGMLVAARNFSSSQESPSFSILEISAAKPVHYALGEFAERSERAYPGFRVEAARAAAEDWEQTEPVEETTKIRAEAVPTGFKITMKEDWVVEEDESIPMPGGDVQPLTPFGMDRILNEGMEDHNSIEVGRMLVRGDVPLRMRPQEIVRTHFGVFGFTGTGKSNLVSTLVSRMVAGSHTVSGMRDLKVVVVDYMQEYYPLLADVFAELDSSMLLYLDAASLPGRHRGEVAEALAGREDTRRAAELLLRNMLVPDEMDREEIRERLVAVLMQMIEEGRIRVLTETSLEELLRKRVHELWESWKARDKLKYLGAGERPIRQLISGLLAQEGLTLTPTVLQQLASAVRRWARDGRVPEHPLESLQEDLDESDVDITSSVQTLNAFNIGVEPNQDLQSERSSQRNEASGRYVVIKSTAQGCLEELAEGLEGVLREWEMAGHLGRAAMPLSELVEHLNGRSENPLLVVALSDRPSQLRRFFTQLSGEIYAVRKAVGQTSPLCLLIIDEADEYISTEKGEYYEEARSAAETIARRGRKLGLGIGIATQRIAYLDTKVISQLHTYFVSKLPRANDRDRVAEAYGVPRSYIDRGLSLKTGEWLVMSHSATRIRGKPVLAKFDNAVGRVRQYFDRASRS